MSKLEHNQDDSDLKPEKEVKDVKFSYFEPIKGITFAVVATVIFLVFPQIITYVFVGNRLIPTFDASVIRSASIMIPAILWALFRIGIEVAYFIERHYTKRLAIITIIGNVLALICGFIIFVTPRIVNVEYSDFIHRYFEDMAAWFSVPLTSILDRPNLIILFLMIFFLVIECITTMRKAKKVKEDSGEVTTEEISADAAKAKAEEAKAEAADMKAVAEEVKAETEQQA